MQFLVHIYKSLSVHLYLPFNFHFTSICLPQNVNSRYLYLQLLITINMCFWFLLQCHCIVQYIMSGIHYRWTVLEQRSNIPADANLLLFLRIDTSSAFVKITIGTHSFKTDRLVNYIRHMMSTRGIELRFNNLHVVHRGHTSIIGVYINAFCNNQRQIYKTWTLQIFLDCLLCWFKQVTGIYGGTLESSMITFIGVEVCIKTVGTNQW